MVNLPALRYLGNFPKAFVRPTFATEAGVDKGDDEPVVSSLVEMASSPEK